MKIIRFVLEIELPEDETISIDKRDELLSEMEEILGREGYSMYDASTEEEDA
jgi:hypothetical protein